RSRPTSPPAATPPGRRPRSDTAAGAAARRPRALSSLEMTVNERGYTVVELAIALLILVLAASLLIPNLRAYSQEVQLMGAAQVFKGKFRLAQSIAMRRGVETAIRFERGADGIDYYSVYVDGNRNGVLSAD